MNLAAGLHRRSAILALIPLCLATTRASTDPAQNLAGRYYAQFKDALVTGEKYIGEDIVEIVPVAPGSAYVRIHLDYYNGHTCGIFGVAQSQAAALVYRDPTPQYDGGTCTLRLERNGRSLSIDDNGGSCSGYCGARGSLSKVTVPYSSKRPIRYLARLKASEEYRDALAEWRKATR
ncbi:MAG TPA: hypothetical protein VE820_04830 [Sphingomicrobium sp.]|nr:hypothetical protein [Sphingomicrobium sp.]